MLDINLKNLEKDIDTYILTGKKSILSDIANKILSNIECKPVEDTVKERSVFGRTRSDVEKYIENFENSIGDVGGDLFKEVFNEKTVYSWSACMDGKIDFPEIEVYDDHLLINQLGETLMFNDMREEDLEKHVNYVFGEY